MQYSFEEIIRNFVAYISEKDFDGDEAFWTTRKYLQRPKILKEDGPLLDFRKWCIQFYDAAKKAA